MGRQSIEKTVASALDGAIGRVEVVGNTLSSLLRLPGLADGRMVEPGSPAGLTAADLSDAEPGVGEVRLQRVDYGPRLAETVAFEESLVIPEDELPPSARVRWWDVRGLHPRVVDRFRVRFGFHPLAAEDVLHVPQRPRVEAYEGYLFVVARLVKLVDGRAAAEQMAFFLYPDTLISFQEDPDDSWEPLRRRVENPKSKIRESGPGFLLYAMLDAVVDHLFPILEHYHELIEDLEDEVLTRPRSRALERIQEIKRDLVVLRRVIWPTRDLIEQLRRTDSPLLDESTRLYLRDAHGHAVHAAEALDALRESANGLLDIHLSASSHRANETMQVLTVTATVFIPLTFLAGVYGMNFEYIPELSYRGGYFVFWAVCVIMAGGLVAFFRRRGWLGGHREDP